MDSTEISFISSSLGVTSTTVTLFSYATGFSVTNWLLII
jgi:hypothetical protein